MEPTITVEKKTDSTYEVCVREGRDAMSTHEVSIDPAYVTSLGWEHAEASLKTLLQQSFSFLLEREPKEVILRQFTLSDIARYFPEYEDEIRSG